MTEIQTLIQLIQLNGKDFKKASNLHIQYYTNPPTDGMEVNRNQAAMLGWAQLLHMQTGRLLKLYEGLSSEPMFQSQVNTVYNYYLGDDRVD